MGRMLYNYKNKLTCPICGKPDLCMTMETDISGEYLYYCSRICQDIVNGHDGQEYVYRYKKVNRFAYYVYEERSQNERNYDNFLREHGYGRYRGMKRKSVPKKAPVAKKKEEIREIIEVAHPNFLDRVYRTFLSLLILESFHRKELEKEWDCGVDPQLSKKLFSKWPIRTLPPNDRVRYNENWVKYENRLRKSIMKDLVEKCGAPIGVPGFYEKEDGSWTCSNLSGIIFPCFNTHGQIIRLRVKDDFPQIKSTFQGKEGRYFFSFYGNEVGWYFKEKYIDNEGRDQYREPLLVYSSSVKKIELFDRKPNGKVDGKYKNFTSYKKMEEEKDDAIYIWNKFKNGAESGSPVSIYVKSGDDLRYVYITEGEKKAMVINMLFNIPVISLPGVGTYGMLFQKEEGYEETILERLKKYGLQNAILIYDADKREKEQVQVHEANALIALYNEVENLFKGEWSENFGKGADDAAIQGVRPKLFKVQY